MCFHVKNAKSLLGLKVTSPIARMSVGKSLMKEESLSTETNPYATKSNACSATKNSRLEILGRFTVNKHALITHGIKGKAVSLQTVGNPN